MNISPEKINNELAKVDDPELGIDVVSLGFIYDINIEQEQVTVRYSLTSPGCPLARYIERQMRQRLLPLFDNPDNLKFELVFDPAWTPDRMSQEAKDRLGWEQS